jgi:hypothetical protein
MSVDADRAEALDTGIFERPDRLLSSTALADAVAGHRSIGAVNHFVDVDESVVPSPFCGFAEGDLVRRIPSRVVAAAVREPLIYSYPASGEAIQGISKGVIAAGRCLVIASGAIRGRRRPAWLSSPAAPQS